MTSRRRMSGVLRTELRIREIAPVASSERARSRMRMVRRRDTSAELAVQAALHERAARFQVDVAPIGGLRRRADILFRRQRLAVFIDGCFWHACPQHASWPRANAAWWFAKINRNRVRDRDTDRRLRDAGWRVVRVWSHENPLRAARRILRCLPT